MKAILICPWERDAVAHLEEKAPLASMPILGKCLVEYWLEHLAELGVREIVILACDRPEIIRQTVSDGRRWGLRIEVIPEMRELTVEEARAKYRGDLDNDWLAAPYDAILMDHLPKLSKCPLVATYANLFETTAAWIQYAQTPDRIGIREIQPGIWAGLRTRISPEAILNAPCWIGDDVQIGPHASIGPMAILENRAVVDEGAEISQSIVQSETFVGPFTAVERSIAWGETLINWQNNSQVDVPDPFLLCSLRQPNPDGLKAGWLARLTAALFLLLSLPVGIYAVCLALARGQPPIRKQVGVRPQARDGHGRQRVFTYFEIPSPVIWLRRWPQIFNIVAGDMTWVGNRPLSPSRARVLTNEFERQWLRSPAGLISLADVRGCVDMFTDEARAHSTFYTAQRSAVLNFSILMDALCEGVVSASPSSTQDLWRAHLKALFEITTRFCWRTFKP
ncbi:MAG TPA: sugar transferase [Verrucomicrobiae bacterium]